MASSSDRAYRQPIPQLEVTSSDTNYANNKMTIQELLKFENVKYQYIEQPLMEKDC